MSNPAYVLTRRRAATTRTWLALGAGLAAVLVLVMLIAAAVAQSRGVEAAGPVGATPSGGAGSLGAAGASPDDGDGTTLAADDGSAPAGTGGQQADPAHPGTAPSPGPADPGSPAEPAGPTIAHFQVLQQPQCPGGTDLNPIPGQPVALGWKVTGADVDEVSLSIDGPGVYQTYPAESSDVITFPCEGEEGGVQEHTYLLTATGDGVTVTETLVVSAKVQAVTRVATTRGG